MILGHEQGAEPDAAAAAGAVEVFAGDEFEAVEDEPTVRVRVEGVVEAGFTEVVAVLADAGGIAEGDAVFVALTEVGGTADTGFGVAATTGFPMTITACVIVLPQTPQLSSTLAVIVYVPG